MTNNYILLTDKAGHQFMLKSGNIDYVIVTRDHDGDLVTEINYDSQIYECQKKFRCIEAPAEILNMMK